MANETPVAGTTPAGSPTATPPAAPAATPNPAEEFSKVKAEKEALERRLAEKDQYIAQVTTEKATLEARLQGIAPKGNESIPPGDIQAEAQRILETAQLDPAAASKDMATLLKKTQDETQKAILANLNPIIEQNTYIAEVRNKNKDLLEVGLEPAITLRANQLIS